MRDALIGACVRLIEARLGVIENPVGMGTPQGRAARVCGPLGAFWRRYGRVLLARLVSAHSDKDDACERCRQCAQEQVRVCAGLR